MEEWKSIKDFEKLYQVSNTGEVYSVKRDKILQPKINKYGYKEVCLYKDGKNYYRTIHRLVAQAFIDNPNNYSIVNHLDSDKLNNNVNNLEWTTVSGNTKHCYNNNKKFHKQVLDNARKGTEKRKKKTVIKGITFNSQVEASKYFNVNQKTIYNWLHQ